MKLFNNNDETQNKGRAFQGDFEDMMAERAKQLPIFQKNIEEHFKHYSGEMTAVITIEEDENGKPKNSSMFIGGVASAESSMKMLKALDKAKDEIIHQMANGLTNNPEVLGEFMGDMLTDIIKKYKN